MNQEEKPPCPRCGGLELRVVARVTSVAYDAAGRLITVASWPIPAPCTCALERAARGRGE